MRLVHRDFHVLAAGQRHFRRTSRIGAALTSLQHPGRRQQLGTMADGSDGLVGLGEGLHQGDDVGIQAQVFRSTATGNDQSVVILGTDLGEIEVERKVVPRLLAVGLVALEIVNGGAYRLAGYLVRANRMHGMADHLQRLERHHGFVVLGVVADQHENLLGSHDRLLKVGGTNAIIRPYFLRQVTAGYYSATVKRRYTDGVGAAPAANQGVMHGLVKLRPGAGLLRNAALSSI